MTRSPFRKRRKLLPPLSPAIIEHVRHACSSATDILDKTIDGQDFQRDMIEAINDVVEQWQETFGAEDDTVPDDADEGDY